MGIKVDKAVKNNDVPKPINVDDSKNVTEETYEKQSQDGQGLWGKQQWRWWDKRPYPGAVGKDDGGNDKPPTTNSEQQGQGGRIRIGSWTTRIASFGAMVGGNRPS